jgi:hypothetical protein
MPDAVWRRLRHKARVNGIASICFSFDWRAIRDFARRITNGSLTIVHSSPAGGSGLVQGTTQGSGEPGQPGPYPQISANLLTRALSKFIPASHVFNERDLTSRHNSVVLTFVLTFSLPLRSRLPHNRRYPFCVF